MGIRLVMEATGRHAPDALTWRERYVLAVLASSAMDATRELPPGIETSPELAARLRLSRTQLYAVLATLCEKGALVHLERGRNGVKATYAIAPFIPGSERPGDPDVPPVENPSKGPSNRDASAAAKGPGSENEGSRFNPSKGPGFRDPAPYIGVRGFKTGGEPPPPPSRPLFPFAVPDAPPEEGDSPRANETAANDGDSERASLVAEILAMRPAWSARSVIRALEKPAVAERPWPLVCEAIRIMAVDPATEHAGRLEHDGPWWPEAERRLAVSARPAAAPRTHAFDPDPETRACRACRGPEVDKLHPRRRTA